MSPIVTTGDNARHNPRMEPEKPSAPWKRFFFRVFTVVAIVVIGAGIVCWFAGWRTVEDFGSALLWCGIVTMVLGGLAGTGGGGRRHAPNFHLAQSHGSSTVDQRLTQHAKDSRATDSFIFVIVSAGILVLLIGLAIIQLIQ